MHPLSSLGQQFATIEAITLTAMLLQKFTFELVTPDSEPAYLPSLTLPVSPFFFFFCMALWL